MDRIPRAHDDKTGSGEPQVTSDLRRDTAVVMAAGELTEPARGPPVRSMTDLLLNVPSLRRSPGTSPPPAVTATPSSITASTAW